MDDEVAVGMVLECKWDDNTVERGHAPLRLQGGGDGCNGWSRGRIVVVASDLIVKSRDKQDQGVELVLVDLLGNHHFL